MGFKPYLKWLRLPAQKQGMLFPRAPLITRDIPYSATAGQLPERTYILKHTKYMHKCTSLRSELANY